MKKRFGMLAWMLAGVAGWARAQAPFPFFDGFESGALSGYWSASSTGNGRIRVTSVGPPYEGAYNAVLDSTSGYALNELVLAVDLAGQTNVFLDCWARNYYDDSHPMPDQFAGSTNADGIALSTDGVTWHRLAALSYSSSQAFTNVLVDLVAFANSRGLTLDGHVRIKFQQYDNFAFLSDDGWAFDNIRLYDAARAADLALGLSASPDPVAAGHSLVYALVVSNSSSMTAEEVVLTNTLPAGAAPVSVTASQGAWVTNGSVIVAELGAIAGGGAATLDIVVQYAAEGFVTNRASVTTTTTEAGAGRNEAAVTTRVDRVGGDLFFRPAVYNRDEARGSVTLTVQRTNGVVGEITVDYETVDGTAVAGIDYTARSGTLTLTNGQTNIQWTVSIQDDGESEPDESFSVRLGHPAGGAVLAAPSNATVTIRDDDGAAAMPFEEDFESGALSNYWATYTTGLLGPQITVSNSPYGGLSHLNMNGDYASYSLNELILSVDLAGREGVYLRFWHKRFQYETDSAMSDSFQGHTYADGVAISVDGTNWYKVQDLTFAETGTNEYRQFDVALDPVLAARGLGFTDRVRIKFQANGYYYPPYYGRFFDDISLYTSAGDLRFSAEDWPVAEGAGAVTVTVERVNGDSGEVSVDYATADSTAAEGDDYAAASGTLVFSNGVRAQSFAVPIFEDVDDEPSEAFTVQLFDPLGGAGLASPTQAVVTIEDDDGPGELSFSAAQYAEQEDTGLAAIAVNRRFGFDGEVSVSWRTQAGTATPGADYVETTGTLTFAEGSAQEIFEVPLLDDADIEGPETVQVFLYDPEDGAALAAPTNAWLTIQDDEAPRAAFPFYEGFESGAWSNYWTVQSSGAGRIALTNRTAGFEGDRSLTMDSASGEALNEATLTVDLSGQTSVILRCWTRDFSDAAHAMPATFTGATNADGIAVSADGLTWHRLVDLAAVGAHAVYTNLVVDLAGLASTQGVPLTATFQVRFQQYDDGAYPSRGRSFDHVSLAPAPAATSTVIRAQDFEGGTGDTWAFRMAPGTGRMAVRPERKNTGARSLLLAGSNRQNADPYLEFDNVSIAGYNHVRLSVAFSASGVDTSDDLYLDLSYNNGASWSGAGSVKLVDGYSNAEIPFGGTSPSNPTTVSNNPWTVEIPAGQTQVKARLRFDERSGDYNNTNDYYFVDAVTLYYLPTNQPPALAPIGDRTALVSNRLEFAVTATDIDGDAVTLTASNLPSGAVFDPVTGVSPVTNRFEFTPDVGQADAVYEITFHAADADGSISETVTVRVLDKVVTFSTNRLFVDEESGGVTIGVALSRPADVTVPLAITGPAELGVDFNLSSTALTFTADGPAEQTFTVTPLDDALPEGPEGIGLALASTPDATAGDDGCDVFLRDDDSVTIATANLTSGGTAVYQGPGERILEALMADVVAIQEFNVTNAGGPRAFVDAHFGTNFSYYVQPSGALPNGVISRWPILDAGVWEDPQVSDREFVWATVDVPGGRPLHVICVHLHYSGGVSSRQLEAAMLTNYIAQAGFHPSDYVVVGGDLNTQNRSEAAWTILKTVVSDDRRPADQNGETDTNQPRDKPYDVVLPNPFLDARHQPVSFGGLTFPEGVVFDTRLWAEDAIPAPALTSDSAALSMQHMGVMKLFALDRFVTLLTTAGAGGSVDPADPEVGVGSNQVFTITADPYCHISWIATNGAAWTPAGQPSELVWTWTNLQENGRLEVGFAESRATNDVPYRWLAGYQLTNETWDAEAMKDGDDDGMAAWEEFLADTDPTDPDSFFAVIQLAGEADRSITFVSSTARVYAVYCTADISEGGEWDVLVQAQPGAGRLTTVSDTNPAPARVYRVGVSVP
ncbi:MAG: DUF11 domain-containing protein [Kiritimatiellae bacterium]|nr:DUF11 domain-containing protein [Kiritimatiellia bacterium]